MAQHQQRPTKAQGLRKSSSNLFDSDNDNRFQTMYAAAFVDHGSLRREGERKSRGHDKSLMSPLSQKATLQKSGTTKITTPLGNKTGVPSQTPSLEIKSPNINLAKSAERRYGRG